MILNRIGLYIFLPLLIGGLFLIEARNTVAAGDKPETVRLPKFFCRGYVSQASLGEFSVDDLSHRAPYPLEQTEFGILFQQLLDSNPGLAEALLHLQAFKLKQLEVYYPFDYVIHSLNFYTKKIDNIEVQDLSEKYLSDMRMGSLYRLLQGTRSSRENMESMKSVEDFRNVKCSDFFSDFHDKFSEKHNTLQLHLEAEKSGLKEKWLSALEKKYQELFSSASQTDQKRVLSILEAYALGVEGFLYLQKPVHGKELVRVQKDQSRLDIPSMYFAWSAIQAGFIGNEILNFSKRVEPVYELVERSMLKLSFFLELRSMEPSLRSVVTVQVETKVIGDFSVLLKRIKKSLADNPQNPAFTYRDQERSIHSLVGELEQFEKELKREGYLKDSYSKNLQKLSEDILAKTPSIDIDAMEKTSIGKALDSLNRYKHWMVVRKQFSTYWINLMP